MSKLLLTALSLCFCVPVLCQVTDTTKQQQLLAELADNACKCIDSISVFDKDKAVVTKAINNCINQQTSAYQMGVLLLSIDTAKAVTKKGKKEINISLNFNENSAEYKKYYYDIESYLMSHCPALKEKIASNDKLRNKSISENKEAYDYYEQGIAESKNENYAKAISYFKKALEIDPEFAFAWDNMGLCYRKSGDYNKALEAYNKSLEVDPQGIMPLQNIPVVYQYKKEYQKAIDAYARLAEVDSENPEIFYGIGNIYTNNLQDYEKGLDNMCKAYALYIKLKSPYRTDAEKIIQLICAEMKKAGKLNRFNEILKQHDITPQ